MKRLIPEEDLNTRYKTFQRILIEETRREHTITDTRRIIVQDNVIDDSMQNTNRTMQQNFSQEYSAIHTNNNNNHTSNNDNDRRNSSDASDVQNILGVIEEAATAEIENPSNNNNRDEERREHEEEEHKENNNQSNGNNIPPNNNSNQPNNYPHNNTTSYTNMSIGKLPSQHHNTNNITSYTYTTTGTVPLGYITNTQSSLTNSFSESKNPSKVYGKLNKKAIAASSVLALGVGAGMMPIFNDDVRGIKEFGIDVHSSTAGLYVETINTLLINSTVSLVALYTIFKNYDNTRFDQCSIVEKAMVNLAKFGSVASSLLPLSQLWLVELNNKEVAKSDGFDQFLTWATLTSIPIVTYNSLKVFDNFTNYFEHRAPIFSEIKALSRGAQVFIVCMNLLGLAGRAITYHMIIEQAMEETLDIDPTVANVSAGVFAGVSSVLNALWELDSAQKFWHKKVEKKHIVQQEPSIQTDQELNAQLNTHHYPSTHDKPTTLKDIALGLVSFFEGAWLTLPLLSCGMYVMQSWHAVIQGILLFPLAIMQVTAEGDFIYKNLAGIDFDRGVNLAGDNLCCHDDNVEQG